MAGYVTDAEVASHFKLTAFTASSAVTNTEVDAFSDEFSRVIDARISKQYETPITDATALLVVKVIAGYLTAAKVMRILNSQVGVSENELNQAKAWEDAAESMLKMLESGEMDLPGATAVTRLSPTSYNQANAIDATWQKGVDQW